jgi:DNA-binding transcriptional LysR family regulator
MPASLIIGASSNLGIYLLPPYIKQFLDQIPSTPKISFTIEANPAIADRLERGQVDLAVMEWWDNRPGFTSRVWLRENLVFIVPPYHPWSSLKTLPKSYLENIEMLGGERGTGTGRILQQFFGDKLAQMRISMQLGSTEAVKRSVQAGLGVSIVLQQSVVAEVEAGSLVAIPIEIDGQILSKDLYVIWRNNLSPEDPAQQFAEFLLSIS